MAIEVRVEALGDTDNDHPQGEPLSAPLAETASTYSGAAGAELISIYELSEAILEHVEPRELLRLQRVCTTWRDVIAESSQVRKKLVVWSFDGIPRDEEEPSLIPLSPSSFVRNFEFGWFRLSWGDVWLWSLHIDIAGFLPADLDQSWGEIQLSEPPVTGVKFFATLSKNNRNRFETKQNSDRWVTWDDDGLTLGDVMMAARKHYLRHKARYGSASSQYHFHLNRMTQAEREDVLAANEA